MRGGRRVLGECGILCEDVKGRELVLQSVGCEGVIEGEGGECVMDEGVRV